MDEQELDQYGHLWEDIWIETDSGYTHGSQVMHGYYDVQCLNCNIFASNYQQLPICKSLKNDNL